MERHVAAALATIDWLSSNARWTALVTLQQALSRFLWVRGLWAERISVAEKALQAARQLADASAEAYMLMDDLGYSGYVVTNSWQAAAAQVSRARDIFDSIGDAYGSVKSRRHLAKFARDRKEMDIARSLYAQAGARCAHIGDPGRRSEMLAGLELSLGKFSLIVGDQAQALAHFDAALAGFRERNDVIRALRATNGRAEALRQCGKREDARVTFEAVIDQAGALRSPDQAAFAHEGLAEIYWTEHSESKVRVHVAKAIELHTLCGNAPAIARLQTRWRTLLAERTQRR